MLLPGTELATEDSKRQWRMVTRYRVLPRCYGYFDVLGSRTIAAEIEEVCVANGTLSFDDYLVARRFHLLVTIFHNDGIFGALLKLLRTTGVPVYGWMSEMARAPMPVELEGLFDSFLRATRDELWDDRGALEAFVQQPDVVERFIAGEIGNNLLFVYKTMAITAHLDALALFARATIRECLAAYDKADPDVFDFVDDVLAYQSARATNLFRDRETVPHATMRFDVGAFLAAGSGAGFRDYRLPAPTTFRFDLDATQQNLIRRYLGIYGDSTVSIGRILSKVHVKKLFRHAAPIGSTEAAIANPGSDVAFHLSGLQE
jgi:hypothetical protein